jgi:hypothetical protein
MRKPIQIGEYSFKTKTEAIEFYKEIINSYQEGDELNNSDFEMVVNLLKNHPDSERKIGCGIEKIVIENGGYNYNCFHLVRQDSSKEDFSYRKCISGEPNDFSLFSQACRKAVESDLKGIKQKYFRENSKNGFVKCQDTGQLINFENSHVDHRQPNTFSVIVDRFIEIKEIKISNVEYDKIDSYGHYLKDKELEKQFKDYHADKANLRIVNKHRNISRSHQARINRQQKDLRIE